MIYGVPYRPYTAAKTIDELRSAVDKAHHVVATENPEWMVSLSFRGLELAA